MLEHFLPKFHYHSILKLQHLVYHQELTNLLALEPHPQDMKKYINNYQRKDVL